MSDSKEHVFWTPAPGEKAEVRFLGIYDPETEYCGPMAYAALQWRLAMEAPLNQPHFCTHEGPWTLHSCFLCDIREAKIVTALVAWLTGQQAVLDKLRPAPYVHCMDHGASLYHPCQRCREILFFRGPVSVTNIYRESAKRIGYTDALGGCPRGLWRWLHG